MYPTLSSDAFDGILESLSGLPSLPQAIVDVTVTINEEDPDIENLANKIEADAGLVADILKLANSSAYAVRGGITSVRRGIVLLGLNEIRRLVLIKGMDNYMRNHAKGVFDTNRFMMHSAAVGCVGRCLARRTSVNPETAFITGLLHDVGQYAISLLFPREYPKVLELKRAQDLYTLEAEKIILGLDHSFVGELLVKAWRLPEEIYEAIGEHHQEERFPIAPTPLGDLVHLAESLAYALELGSDGKVPLVSYSALARLNLTVSDIAKEFPAMDAEFSHFKTLLDVNQ
jgi:HD-like signal output (HDOD) protein